VLSTAFLAVALAAPALQLAPCGEALPGAECGHLTVFENRATHTGRTLDIQVADVRATGKERASDPLFFFAGGPGLGATRMAGGAVDDFAAILKRRDLVFVDTRGTGGSHPLECALYLPADSPQAALGDFFPPEAVKACRTELEKTSDLTQYTTPLVIDDVDDVRAALGYDQINLWGGSYGTRAALVYVRRHGAHVRSMMLVGVEGTRDPMPLHFARDAQRALNGVFADCAADKTCHAAFPDLAGDMQRAQARLAKPVEASILHPETGELVKVALSRDLFGEALRYLMYQAGSASLVPALVHAAAQGDFDALAEYALFNRQHLMGIGDGLYLSVTCAEDLPFITPGTGETEAQGTFLGDYRLLQQRRACSLWPRGAVPAGFQESVKSPVPALLLSGEWDPVTPPEQGARTAADLPNSLHVVVPHSGHSYDGLSGVECISKLQTDFVERGSVKGLDASCVAAIKRNGFSTQVAASRPIALDPALVAPLAGRWVGDGAPIEATIVADGARLRVTLAGEHSVLLVPVAPRRFRVVGELGSYVRVEGEGAGNRLELEENGAIVIALKRAP
jgi:pimeloyl-ACP methyl ester carboxylesterase